jgi:PAS domain S-box-containing protein
MSELRVLIVEDFAADAELMARALRNAGLACVTRRVATREEFLRELTDFDPGLILADYSLPQFGALDALHLARKLGPPVPFIVVSGTIDDETAVGCLQAGAADYVLKDNLARLPAAIGVALGSHRARVERRRAEEAYRTLVDNSLQGLIIIQGTRVVFANRAFAEMSGYTVEEILAGPPDFVMNAVHPDDREMVMGRLRARQAGKEVPDRYEFRGLSKDGSMHWLEMQAVNVTYEGEAAVMTAFIDATDRRRAEEALRDSEQKFRSLLLATREAVALHELVLDGSGEPVDFVVLEANPAFERLLGIAPDGVPGARGSQLFGGDAARRLARSALTPPGGEPRSLEAPVAAATGRVFSVAVVPAGKGRFTTVVAQEKPAPRP